MSETAPARKKRDLRIIVVAAILTTLLATASIVVSTIGTRTNGAVARASSLPAGCIRPAGGFLVIASALGYNDSVDHGAPGRHWPIITVQQGQTASIVVCNVDAQAQGFQIAAYAGATLGILRPGQVLTISFVASQTGTFHIYDPVFNTLEAYMNSGELIVMAGTTATT